MEEADFICVECGYPKSRHGRELQCPFGNGKFGTMQLPKGKTCRDCIHLRRCVAIFGVKAENEFCDFFPIRFVEKASQ